MKAALWYGRKDIRVEDVVEKGFEVLTSGDVGKEMKIQVSFEN